MEQLLKLANALLGQYGPIVALLVVMLVALTTLTARFIMMRLSTVDKQRAAEIEQYIRTLQATNDRYIQVVEKTEERYSALVREVLAHGG